MLVSIRMRAPTTLSSPRASTSSQTQVFHQGPVYLFPTETLATIWLNGAAQICGKLFPHSFPHSQLIFNRPANKEELFNLRHASARNAVERIFGVLKRRFRILSIPPEYNLQVQATVPVALAAIHNFIQYHSDSDQDRALEHEAQMPPVGQQVEHLGEGGEDTGPGDRSGDVDVEEDEDQDEDQDQEGEDDGEGADEDHEEVGAGQNSNALRDRIAHAMWNDYQLILQERLRDGELDSE